MNPGSGRECPAQADDLEDLFENAPCGYLSADRGARIVRANATLAGWFGQAPSDLVGRRFADLLTIGGKLFYETHFAPMLRMQGSFSEVALELACPGGRLPVLVNAVERRDPDGEPRFIRIIVVKAAERRRYEGNLLAAKTAAEEATAAEREAAVLREQFIAVLGHDLRNPLAALASGARLLEQEALSERGRKVLGLMDGSIGRALTLIDNVLDFARAGLGGGFQLEVRQARPLAPVIEQVVAELQAVAPERTIESRIAIDDPVEADPGRIGQLASNLMGNALSHGAADQPVRLTAVTGDGAFVLSVANGGEPIAPATMEYLFRPFFRGALRPNQNGLGLGLYIASEIARAHGGAIEVSSSPEETRFTFRMPLRQGTD